MFCFRKIIFSLILAGAVCGCTSYRDSELIARILREADNAEMVVSVPRERGGPNKPDEKDSPLPPIPRDLPPSSSGERIRISPLTIQPECLVMITVEEDPSLDGTYQINEIGAIDFGYIGPIILFNKTESEAAEKIEDVLLARDFKSATVRASIKRASYDKVRVEGAVNKPGIFDIGAGDSISLNDAILRAGGLRQSARGAKVKIIREGMLNAVWVSMPGEEYPLVTEDGDPSVPDVFLRNNDIAQVFSGVADVPGVSGGGERLIYVLGEVPRPGIYPFSADEPCTIMHLMFKVGDLSTLANKKKVKIFRKTEKGSEREINVNVEEIIEKGNIDEDVPLENGDRVVVPSRRKTLF